MGKRRATGVFCGGSCPTRPPPSLPRSASSTATPTQVREGVAVPHRAPAAGRRAVQAPVRALIFVCVRAHPPVFLFPPQPTWRQPTNLPGNLLKVTSGPDAGKLCLLDFGLVAEVPERDRENMVSGEEGDGEARERARVGWSTRHPPPRWPSEGGGRVPPCSLVPPLAPPLVPSLSHTTVSHTTHTPTHISHHPPRQPGLAVPHRRLCRARLSAARLRPGRHHPCDGQNPHSLPGRRRRQSFQLPGPVPRPPPHDARNPVFCAALHVAPRPLGRHAGRHRPAGQPRLPDGGPSVPVCRAQSAAQLVVVGRLPAARHCV